MSRELFNHGLQANLNELFEQANLNAVTHTKHGLSFVSIMVTWNTKISMHVYHSSTGLHKKGFKTTEIQKKSEDLESKMK